MLCIIWWVLSHYKEGISTHHFQNFSRNLNVDGQNLCYWMVSRKISLFCKIQRGRSPSFELFQLDMYEFVFFGSIGKTRWPLWPLICRDISDFSSETAQRNSTKLDTMFVFCIPDRKNKMAALASDLPRHFGPLLRNCSTEFNETWYHVCILYSRSEKQDGCPGLRLAENCSISPLKPLYKIQWNLTGSKISMSSTIFVFLGLIGKTRWPPWPLICWDIFDFSCETAQRISRNLTGSKISASSTKFVVFHFATIRMLFWCIGLCNRTDPDLYSTSYFD